MRVVRTHVGRLSPSAMHYYAETIQPRVCRVSLHTPSVLRYQYHLPSSAARRRFSGQHAMTKTGLGFAGFPAPGAG